MARIAGINLPDQARVEYALTLIYGIGFNNVRGILKQTNVDDHKRIHELTEDEVKNLQAVIEKTIKVEGDLKEELNTNIKRLKEIGSYRGMRHARALPARGQRTKTNARTKR
ncbi:MAG TPA: 30S ribosomal protein S13, partial [Candidatus Nitrosocosmicus sp.]|nr:30S ribosomal protein S13 [Candidatus Nitrosocosmicus sp.]